jgi:hypothetical protein
MPVLPRILHFTLLVLRPGNNLYLETIWFIFTNVSHYP